MGLNLGDTRRCPVRDRCERCERCRVARRVWTAVTEVGIFCVTLCRECFDDDWRTPPICIVPVVTAVLEHCDHLGISSDEMTKLMARNASLLSAWESTAGWPDE